MDSHDLKFFIGGGTKDYIVTKSKVLHPLTVDVYSPVCPVQCSEYVLHYKKLLDLGLVH